MTMMIQRVNANSPAHSRVRRQKSRARGPTITQLRAKQAALWLQPSSQLRSTSPRIKRDTSATVIWVKEGTGPRPCWSARADISICLVCVCYRVLM